MVVGSLHEHKAADADRIDSLRGALETAKKTLAEAKKRRKK